GGAGVMSVGGLYVRDGGEFVANTSMAGDQTSRAVAALASGGYVVVWNGASGQGLCAQRYDASGNKVGGEIVVNATANLYIPGTIVALTSGGFAVAWADLANPYNTMTRIQVFDSAGSKIAGEIVAAFGGVDLDGAAISGDRF